MTYEFNPKAQRFEAPNPHFVENLFMLAGGGALVLAGLAALVSAKHLAATMGVQSGPSILIGALLFAGGLFVLGNVLRQLKFYFGREQPLSFPNEQRADSFLPTAANVRAWLRQNAINYQIPHSGMDQLLYTLVPNLVFSPLPLQHVAQAQFRNLMVFVAIVLSAVVALVGISSAISNWVAIIYFGMAMALVLRIWKSSSGRGAQLSVLQVVLLAVGSIVGPILLSLTGIGEAPLAGVVNWTWLSALAVGSTAAMSALLLWTVTRQVIVPNSISMANNVQVVSFNVSPNQLYVELDRQMQANWTEQIPNRKYFRREPVIQGEKGSFDGEVMEETQPVPESQEPLTLGYCWNSAEYRPLILLDCAILALLLIAAVTGYLSAGRNGSDSVNLLVTCGVSYSVAMFGFHSSQSLWRRFRFRSRIYWMEIQGNFQQANVGFGAVLDRLQTRKQVTNVEDMTLRVWVAEIDSICYGRDGYRWVVGFAGLPQVAADMGNSLAHHMRESSMIVAPTGSKDLQRSQLVAAMNDASGAASKELQAGAALMAAAASGVNPTNT